MSGTRKFKTIWIYWSNRW